MIRPGAGNAEILPRRQVLRQSAPRRVLLFGGRACDYPRMLILRRILVLFLSFSVPTTVLASLMDTGHCHKAPRSSVSVSADTSASHVGMDMSIRGARANHMMQTAAEGAHSFESIGSLSSADQIGCKCGCNCSTTHCATAGAALATIADFDNGFFYPSLSRNLIRFGPTHAIAAHGLDILRPPCTS